MKIAMIVEGKTEKEFLKYHLKIFLLSRLPGRMPDFDIVPSNGLIPTKDKLRRVVQTLLSGRDPADHVIALTDVYTGHQPPIFVNAQDAREKLRQWVGCEPRFHPHAAQHDFEAWLIPYWETIKEIAGTDRSSPRGNPENINHNHPPAHLLETIFINGRKKKKYSKPRDAKSILDRIIRDRQDLLVAINQCSELKALVNTILRLCDGAPIP